MKFLTPKWAEKVVVVLQAVLIMAYIWFTFHQEIRQKQKIASKKG